MEHLSGKLARHLLDKGVILQTDFNICKYGLQVAMELFISLAVSFVFAISLHMVLEYVVFF